VLVCASMPGNERYQPGKQHMPVKALNMRGLQEPHQVGTAIAIIGCLMKKASNRQAIESLVQGCKIMCGLAYRMGFESFTREKLLIIDVYLGCKNS
jgi:hypothetical protein